MDIVSQNTSDLSSPKPKNQIPALFRTSGAAASATSRHAQFFEHGGDVAGRASAGLVDSAISGRASSLALKETQTKNIYEAVSAEKAAWRARAVKALAGAGMTQEAADLSDCGKFIGNFKVQVCEHHLEHDVKAVPFRCHLRFCPDCEHDSQALKVARYLPVVQKIAELKNLRDDPHPTWSLKKIELTTPFCINAPNAPEQYLLAWKFFERWIQILFVYLLNDELSPAELRRGRVDLTKHGAGVLASTEFGERGLKLHFHIVIYGPFIGKHMLSRLWSDATGGVCKVTWIKRIDAGDVEKTLREMLKYVTKFNALPPQYVPNLASILKGNRRLRTYGVFRGQPKPEKRECSCKVCSGAMVKMAVASYFQACFSQGLEPSQEIAALAPRFFLEFKPRNNSGEAPEGGQHLARSDPDETTNQASLPYLDALIKPFEYG